GVSADLPVRLVEHETGRLALYDPETGWDVSLSNFGQSNRAAFAKLLD
ncbi:MAG: photosynthetic complex assembly protein PuhC, partial [Pseudomonadota bacterium]